MDARGQVSLTFDGCLQGHLELVAPLLAARNLPATFYAYPTNVLACLRAWEEVAANGNEIGNGCLLGATQTDGSLPNWPLQAVADEIESCDLLLAELFGTDSRRTFAYPWGSPICGLGDDYRFAVKARHAHARSGVEGHNRLGSTDFSYLRAVLSNDLSGPKLIQLASAGLADKEWVIFAFEGIGEGERAIDLHAFKELIAWLPPDLVRNVQDGVESWQSRHSSTSIRS
jgi:hypothetical protein